MKSSDPSQNSSGQYHSDAAPPSPVEDRRLFRDWSVAPSSVSSLSALSSPGSSMCEDDLECGTRASDGVENPTQSPRQCPKGFSKISFATNDDVELDVRGLKRSAPAAEPEDGDLLPPPPSKRPGVSHARKTPADHIKRPRNAYILFRSHTVAQNLIPQEVERDHRNISRIISHMWKSLGDDERAIWTEQAKREQEEHKRKYPDYRYQPTTRRENVMKRNVKKLENGDEECQEIADVILKAQGRPGVVVAPPAQPKTKSTLPRKPRAAKTSSAKPKASRRRAQLRNKGHDTPEQVLETVFLRASPPAKGSCGQTDSCAVSTAASPAATVVSMLSRVPDAEHESEFEHLMLRHRRASSAPAPPPPFEPPSPLLQPAAEQTSALNDAVSRVDGSSATSKATQPERQREVTFAIAADNAGVDTAVRASRSRPAPIYNTWQHSFCDDQALPSPRSVEVMMSPPKVNARPRTALPPTPGSSSIRGFFHPWAYESGSNPMLISPMCNTFQDLRRRSSLARFHSYRAFSPSDAASARVEQGVEEIAMAPPSHMEATLAPHGMSGSSLFEEAARAAASSLMVEAQEGEQLSGHVPEFVFDPALEEEDRLRAEALEKEPEALEVRHNNVRHSPAQAPLFPQPWERGEGRRWSPRPSFSGSTLAAAARDWTSTSRRRSSRFGPRHLQERCDSVLPPMYAPSVSPDPFAWAPEEDAHGADAKDPLNLLKDSIERAIADVFRRHQPQSDSGQGSVLTQEILASLGAELLSKHSTRQAVPQSEAAMLLHMPCEQDSRLPSGPHRPMRSEDEAQSRAPPAYQTFPL
ncbi:hypothetical protein BCV70DRAFT_221899 [Testicularia cyperi]|uniref:HMG box domain-containing protein n=1 Tax=Testicularia cyperi TaxID=1882483 RepID=A0A317XVA7_9BASI|nr:hypothetical protein BCV70DRAFT_221899 [Testicularia cyperi]